MNLPRVQLPSVLLPNVLTLNPSSLMVQALLIRPREVSGVIRRRNLCSLSSQVALRVIYVCKHFDSLMRLLTFLE